MRGKPWSAADTATLHRMAKGGYSDSEIAKHIGVWRETVTNRRRLLGLAPGRGSGSYRYRRLILDNDGGGGETPSGGLGCLSARILLQS